MRTVRIRTRRRVVFGMVIVGLMTVPMSGATAGATTGTGLDGFAGAGTSISKPEIPIDAWANPSSVSGPQATVVAVDGWARGAKSATPQIAHVPTDAWARAGSNPSLLAAVPSDGWAQSGKFAPREVAVAESTPSRPALQTGTIVTYGILLLALIALGGGAIAILKRRHPPKIA